MGCIVTINFTTTNPNYRSKLQSIASKIRTKYKEPVDISVGITDDQSSLNTIQVGQIISGREK